MERQGQVLPVGLVRRLDGDEDEARQEEISSIDMEIGGMKNDESN